MSVFLPPAEHPLDGLPVPAVVTEKIVRELRAENAELRRVLRALAHRAMANIDALDVPEAPESFRCWAGSHKPGRVQATMKDRWTDDEPPFFAKCHKEPPAGDDFTPEEKLGAMLALALAAILFVAFLAAFGPMDAPSPNTVGLK